jgi:hypothetical protein
MKRGSIIIKSPTLKKKASDHSLSSAEAFSPEPGEKERALITEK